MTYGTVLADQIQNTTGYTLGAGNATNFKNRIINGAMNINQYALSSTATALGSSGYYLVDRFQSIVSQASKLYAGYNTGAVTPPGGFQNYLAFTCGATATLGASDYFGMWQKIEANNVSDIQWGTANAISMTLSFWVYSNTTGTFGGSVQNASQTRSYPFVYTVASSNTWQKITITVPGDTSGSWTLNGTGASIYVVFGLEIGSNYQGTPTTWSGGNYLGGTGMSNTFLSSTSNYVYITGIQFEVGSYATGFEYRDIGRELILCQRYYQTGFYSRAIGGTNGSGGAILYSHFPLITTMRATPSCSASGTVSVDLMGAGTFTSSSYGQPVGEGINGFKWDISGLGASLSYAYVGQITNAGISPVASAEL